MNDLGVIMVLVWYFSRENLFSFCGGSLVGSCGCCCEDFGLLVEMVCVLVICLVVCRICWICVGCRGSRW